MEIIKPTKKQVFDDLRKNTGCCWLGGSKCHCYSRQLCDCYNDTERRLTKTILTEEEIKAGQEQNAKAMREIDNILHELFD